MKTVAESAEDSCRELDRLGDHGEIFSAEDPCGMLRVRLNQDGKLDLALELIELRGLLGLGDGKVVAGDVVDSEVMLLQDVLGLGSVMKVIKAEMNATGKDRNAVGKASILRRDVSKTRTRREREGVDTYQLHLMLNTEQLMLRIRAGNGAIGQTSDELVARNIVNMVLGQLVGEGPLNIDSRDREDGLVLLRDDSAIAVSGLGGDDSGLAVVLAMLAGTVAARDVGRVQSRVSASKRA